MKNVFAKMATNVKTNMQCRENRIVTVLCLGVLAFNVTVLALSPFIK